jgi:hypothetical protein
LLPEDAPETYKDRQTLWRAVETKERRHDARLAREIEVALQTEFNLQENIELLREYIKENFTDKGMIADLAIHHARNDNPHAHIMLTTRHVTSEGFKGKKRDWDKDGELIRWRENWAEINNRKFEEKGLDIRIDHRTLKAQGIDRLPTIHLGHKATALERKGIRTEKGDYNRAIKHRQTITTSEHDITNLTNEERVALKDVEQKEQRMAELHKMAKEIQLEKTLQKIRKPPKTAQYIEKSFDPESEPSFVSELEKQLKVEKAAQHIERMQTRDAAKIARRMNTLKETYIALETEKNPLIENHNRVKSEIPSLEYWAESMDEHVTNIDVLRDRVERLREVRRGLRFLDWKKKKIVDEKIVLATQELDRAQDFFRNHFRIDSDQAVEELNRRQEKICAKKEELYAKQVRVQIIQDKQVVLELEYHMQKLLNELRSDQEQIAQLLEQMNQPPGSVCGRLLREQVERRLEVISDFHFERAVEKLPQRQADLLIDIRKQTKEQERLCKFERDQAFLTRYYQTQDKDERKRLLRAEDEQRSQTYGRSR